MSLENVNLFTQLTTRYLFCAVLLICKNDGEFTWLLFRDVEKITLLKIGRDDELKKSCFLVTEQKESLKNRATALSISLTLICMRIQLNRMILESDRYKKSTC